jgi:hypothetical protein
MRWLPNAKVKTTVHSPRTVVTLRTTGDRIFVAKRRAFSTPLVDEQLQLRLDRPSYFGVESLDVDHAAAQVIGAGAAKDGQSAAPPAGRSAGLTLVQKDRATYLGKVIGAAHASAQKLRESPPVLPDLYAEDLVIGHHVQVARAVQRGLPQWRGIGHRQVEYSVTSGDAAAAFTDVDEAAVTVAARQPAPATDPGLLYVSDVLARWDGWSIAVPRPGRIPLQTDEDTTKLGDKLPAPARSYLRMTPSVPETAEDGSEGRLETLRYGARYLLRARSVDVTGSGRPWASPATSAATPYYRWDPAAAPLVLPPKTLTATETARTLVVRSDPVDQWNPGIPSARTLAPTRVAVEVGMLHGLFDDPETRTPAVGAYERIVALDSSVPPSTTGDDAGPLTVDWLPDPMVTACHVEAPGLGGRDLGFLPAGDDDLGRTALGSWQSALVRLEAGAPGSTSSIGQVDEGGGQRRVTVTLRPGEVRTIMLRAQPEPARLDEHGLVPGAPGSTDQEKAAAVAAGQVPVLTPSTELQLVHAVRQPLTAPSFSGTPTRKRALGAKDPEISARVYYDELSTGRLSLVASWKERVDNGAKPRSDAAWAAPSQVDVVDSPVVQVQLDPGQGDGAEDLVSRMPFPDLRRRDLKVRTVATSAFVEAFREELEVTWQTIGTRKYLRLPAGVDLESVLITTATGAQPARGTDYVTSRHPDTGVPTFSVRALEDVSAWTVLGVVGTVLASTPEVTVIVPSAVRPAPPKPVYAVPAFLAEEPTADNIGRWTARRSPARVRIWLERPWWSSGDGEQLAVITSVVGATLGTEDATRLERLVTTYAADPAQRGTVVTERTRGSLPGGTFVDRLKIDEGLADTVQSKATFNAHVFGVKYDDERDLYYAEVPLPTDLPAGTFVRLAVARYQPEMAPTGSADVVKLSRIVTLDPVQVLPDRTAFVRYTPGGGGITVSVGGPTHPGPSDALAPLVRVTVQSKVDGGDGVGWQTVATGRSVWSHDAGGYPDVDVPIGAFTDQMQVLIEELERYQAVTDAGAALTPAAYEEQLTSLGGAVNDLLGTRPVWVAVTPMPLNV